MRRDKKTLDCVIQEMQKDLQNLKKQRKKRSDNGCKRKEYISELPKDFKIFLNKANSRGIKVEIIPEVFTELKSKPCVYCGSPDKIGMDRKDSKIGYTLNNTQSCCGVCNLMKFTHTEDFFKEHVNKISNYLKTK